MPQISSQAVAHVDHTVNLEIRRQPAALFKTRLKIQVLAGDRSTEFASSKDGIAHLRARPADKSVLVHPTLNANRHQYPIRICRGFATHHRNLIPRSERTKPAINPLDMVWVKISRQRHCDQS